MRVPIQSLSPLAIFWCAIYVLALFSIYAAGVLASNSEAKQSPAKSIRSDLQFGS